MSELSSTINNDSCATSNDKDLADKLTNTHIIDSDGDDDNVGDQESALENENNTTKTAPKKKKKKQTKKAAKHPNDMEITETTCASSAITSHSLVVESSSTSEITQAQVVLDVLKQFDERNLKAMNKEKKLLAAAANKEHKFWDTQPVASLDKQPEKCGPVDRIKTVEEVKQEPYNMPAGFDWCNIDVTDPEQLQELYTLLSENYVEDDDCHFRFDYSTAFLQWALSPPGFYPDWIVGVRNIKTQKLMGSITGIPAHVTVNDTTMPMCEINFLCVHKKLRDKRLAPVLIKEITRRVNLRNIWQATYTAGVVLPRPAAKCKYFHRSLNVKKLVDIRFSYVPAKATLASHSRSLKLKPTPMNKLRPLQLEDCVGAHRLLVDYLQSRTKLFMIFSLEEFIHVFMPRENVVNTFVIEGAGGEITDMCSFYHLPSTIIGNETHKTLSAVYSYYNVATTVPLEELMADALILAKGLGADVFNALNLMENKCFLSLLKFGEGDGFLQYYLYNWQCPEMPSNDVGLVLL